jgi:starch phosphorylase
VLRDFAELWPERFSNKTNGVTPRRFMALINPGLTRLITESIGNGWLTDLERLRELEPLAEDAGFLEKWRRVKRDNKEALAREIRTRCNVEVDPDSLFDLQIKRIHEYKRQHLNLLRLITAYQRLIREPERAVLPRTVIFAGKAAPGYDMAKRIIRAIHGVAEVVNADPLVAGRLRIAFLPDYNVKNCERLFPGAELSEQISTAGKEASGTGNMKAGLNGALTIGTLDGANVEIREAVGAEHFFLFGLTIDEVNRLSADGYHPGEVEAGDDELHAALEALADGTFSRGDDGLFRGLVDRLRCDDPFLVLADYRSYVDCQERVDAAYCDVETWARSSIINTARMGRFSSDRAIAEYCRDIWRVEPLPIDASKPPIDESP